MWHILSDPLAERVAWALIHFLWQGAAIATLLVVVLRLRGMQSPQRRYALSVTALALMAICPLATGVFAEHTPPAVLINAFPASIAETVTVAPPQSQSPLAVSQPAHAWQPYFLAAWFTGVLLFALRLLTGYCGTLWLCGGRTSMPAAFSHRIIELSRRLALAPAEFVYASPRVREALVVGFWQPMVLVPLVWLTELPPDVLEAVIAHELAHVRRWDRWIVLFQRSIETLLFYHPAVWWVSRRISFERELCCDEMAVAATGRRLAYARALEAVGCRSLPQSALVFATSFQGESQMNLLSRVRNVLGLGAPRESGFAWPAGLLALALTAGMACWSLVLAADEEDKPKAAREGEVRKDGEQEKRKSPEAEGVKRKSAEAESGKKVSEEEIYKRKLNEAKARASKEEAIKAEREEVEAIKRKQQATERKEDVREARPLSDFRPETDREAALYKLVLMLRDEVAQLRQEVSQMRKGGDSGVKPGARDGDAPKKPGAKDGDVRKPGPRDGDAPVKKGPRDGEAPVKPGPRDGDAPVKKGPREGDKAPR